MRKVNKILMTTVAILLCLVLISTSVVSGIFAKFIINKQAQVSMTIEKFDVTLKITPDEDGKMTAASLKAPTITRVGDPTTGDVITATFDDVSITMGDSFPKALKVELSGTPNVPIFFKVTCHVEYDYSGVYKVPTTVGGVTKAQSYMPLGYMISFDGTTEYICRPYHNKNNNELEEIILRNLYNYLYIPNKSDRYGSAGTCPYVKQPTGEDISYMFANYSAGTALTGNVGAFYLGFDWAHEYDKKDYSEIATYLSEKAANSKIKFVYTFSIEQGQIATN